MQNQFFRVKDMTSLEALIEQSQANPVVIFKHSTTCPISASAYEEMQQVSGEVNLVEVQSARPVSEELEKRLGIRHESPQVIILRRGKAVWDASHWRIKADAVADAVRENA